MIWGDTVRPEVMKRWFFSGYTNAAAERELRIWNEVEGLYWHKKIVTNVFKGPIEQGLDAGASYWVAEIGDGSEDIPYSNAQVSRGNATAKKWVLYQGIDNLNNPKWVLDAYSRITHDGVVAPGVASDWDSWMELYSVAIHPAIRQFHVAINLQFYNEKFLKA